MNDVSDTNDLVRPCGLPIVTLAGTFMRARQSAGMLGLLGVPEVVARDRSDYLAIAPADPRRTRRLFDAPDAIEPLQNLLQTGAPPA
jgi:hypothetical protein